MVRERHCGTGGGGQMTLERWAPSGRLGAAERGVKRPTLSAADLVHVKAWQVHG